MFPAASVRGTLTRRRAIPALVLLGSLGLVATAATHSPAQDTAEKTWQGTWNNRKFGTSGPLKCTVTAKDDKTWDATFEGMFMSRRFSHKVTIAATKKGDRTLLEGTATIDGDSYRWQGNVAGRVLYGRFRSGSGNNGEFRLTEPKK
jgi:hypothetical protein